MLVDKRKTKAGKKKTHAGSPPSEESIQSFRSWIRKIEQATNSLSSRLSAVEKRISREKLEYSTNQFSGDMKKGCFERIFTVLQEEKKDKNILELSRVIDSDFAALQEELVSQQIEISSLKEKIDELDSLLTSFQEEIKQLQITDSKMLNDVNLRVEKIERREPPMMKLGRMEIPIELTGVIGGILAFIIAILVALGEKEIIISPLFLSLVGFILIGSAVFKTFNIGSTVDKTFKKTSKIEERS